MGLELEEASPVYLVRCDCPEGGRGPHYARVGSGFGWYWTWTRELATRFERDEALDLVEEARSADAGKPKLVRLVKRRPS